MNLIIDIGNTHSKLALFDEDRLAEKSRTDNLSETVVKDFVNGYQVDGTIVCIVGEEPNFAKGLFTDGHIILDHTTPLPISNKYSSPSTLGYDRIASVIGASVLISNREILCVDIGTCITYDLLDSDRNYLGGGISPGLSLRFKALNNFTEKLPLIDFDNNSVSPPLIGSNTEESIKSGVFHGMISELNGIISSYKEKYPNLAVVLTGGNAELFESYIKSEIFAFPDSVLHGLNAILEYNKE